MLNRSETSRLYYHCLGWATLTAPQPGAAGSILLLHPSVRPLAPSGAGWRQPLATETIWDDLSSVTELLERLYAALHQSEKVGRARDQLEHEIENAILLRAVLTERLGADTGEAA